MPSHNSFKMKNQKRSIQISAKGKDSVEADNTCQNLSPHLTPETLEDFQMNKYEACITFIIKID